MSTALTGTLLRGWVLRSTMYAVLHQPSYPYSKRTRPCTSIVGSQRTASPALSARHSFQQTRVGLRSALPQARTQRALPGRKSLHVRSSQQDPDVIVILAAKAGRVQSHGRGCQQPQGVSNVIDRCKRREYAHTGERRLTLVKDRISANVYIMHSSLLWWAAGGRRPAGMGGQVGLPFVAHMCKLFIPSHKSTASCLENRMQRSRSQRLDVAYDLHRESDLFTRSRIASGDGPCVYSGKTPIRQSFQLRVKWMLNLFTSLDPSVAAHLTRPLGKIGCASCDHTLAYPIANNNRMATTHTAAGAPILLTGGGTPHKPPVLCPSGCAPRAPECIFNERVIDCVLQ
eukprot:1404657-Pyramimonas_sp.AAC.1